MCVCVWEHQSTGLVQKYANMEAEAHPHIQKRASSAAKNSVWQVAGKYVCCYNIKAKQEQQQY